MSASPAAVFQSRSEAPTALERLHLRLRSFIKSQPEPTRRLLAEALLPDPATSPEPGHRNDFYWLLLPEWLAPAGDEALDDILWAQYCIYCLLRAQDDAVDGERDGHLGIAANPFLMEATLALQRHFDHDSALWPWLHEAVAATSQAVIEIDARQQRPDRDGGRDLDHFATLSRCLTVAARAIVERGHPGQLWPQVLAVCDRMAIAAQILDDFHDLESDLRHGQYNYAAWELTRPVFAASVDAVQAIVATRIASGTRLPRLFARIRATVEPALDLPLCSRHPSIGDYLRRFQRTVARTEEDIRRGRARLLGRSAA